MKTSRAPFVQSGQSSILGYEKSGNKRLLIYTENIYSFVVNTITIFIECNRNSSVMENPEYFHECETRMKI